MTINPYSVFFGIWILTGILANAALINNMFSLSPDKQVYLRNLMFSEIIADHQRVDLNQIIEQGFKRDTDINHYKNYVSLESIKKLNNNTYSSDAELAWAIVSLIGRSDGSVCGLETLDETVSETSRGKGCCSDYSKAWLFYANLMGLPAREVSLFNHTTVEYLDRATGRWHWLDPFHHYEIINHQGQVFSLLEVRNARYGEDLRMRTSLLSEISFDANGYAGYSRAQMGAIFWRRGTNFLEIETWDKQFRAWGLPKNVRQFAALLTGVQPGWLMLTTDADYFYYNLLRALIWFLMYFWLVLNVVWLIASFLLGTKIFTKYRNQSLV
jgi:hypothetical protein